MAATAASGGRWTRVRTLGRGASGAEVFLAADEASGELFVVKAAPASAGAAAETLRREQGLMAGLRSPHVVPCAGGRAGRDGSYQLFLEFAPGGSLADAAARSSGGRLPERDAAAYAADVTRGLAYVHGAGLVHGDVKPRNVVIGRDGRAKLADFGCARRAAGSKGPIGGTPAFMAPEVARGEEQGPAADVWALGCTVVEMATGRAPWSGVVGGDVLAAVRLIGYTDAAPEVPKWLSTEARDFVGRCLARRPGGRPTAAQLLEHPFLASAGGCEAGTGKWVSPKSTLDAAFWESDDSDDEDHDVSSQSTAERMGALACPASALPDWDADEGGWIDVLSTATQASKVVTAPAAEEAIPCADGGVGSEERVSEVAESRDIDVDSGAGAHNVGETDASAEDERHQICLNSGCGDDIPCKLLCNTNNAVNFVLAQILLCSPPFLNSEIPGLSLSLCSSSRSRSRCAFTRKFQSPECKIRRSLLLGEARCAARAAVTL